MTLQNSEEMDLSISGLAEDSHQSTETPDVLCQISVDGMLNYPN
jgi:hypothetical protein